MNSYNEQWLAAAKLVDVHLDSCSICGPILTTRVCSAGKELLRAYEQALELRNQEAIKLFNQLPPSPANAEEPDTSS